MGDGWYYLGTVTADDSASSLIVVTCSGVTQVCLVQQTTAMAYDADGNVIATTDAQGRITASTYDDSGNVIDGYQGQVVASVTDAAGYSSTGTLASTDSTWTFDDLSPTARGPTNFTPNQASLSSLTANGSPGHGRDHGASLGAGWQDLGSVTVSDSTDGVSVNFTGTPPAAVALLDNTSQCTYDLDGEAVSTTTPKAAHERCL